MLSAHEGQPGGAKERIIDACIRCIVRDGLAGSSMALIAAEGGVSKALLHYHFSDREQLLAHVVETLGHRVVRRESVLVRDTNGNPVDHLWQWVLGELEQGELRALLILGTVRNARVLAAREGGRVQRHLQAMRTVEHLFDRLALVPRVPAGIIADTHITFVDGLALNEREELRTARTRFDVLWLAFLSLAG